MRIKSIFAILLFATVTTIVVYFITRINHYEIPKPKTQVKAQITDIENSIKKEFEQNSLLLKDFKDIIEYVEDELKVEETGKERSTINQRKKIESNQSAIKSMLVEPVIPVIVFACNRITVKKCLDQLIRYRPSKEQFPIIVSQVNINYNNFNLEHFYNQKHISNS